MTLKFQVWLNDGRSNQSVSALGIGPSWSQPTVVTVEAETVMVRETGELEFIGIVSVADFPRRIPIECFARGTWTRWRLVE